MSRKPIFDYLRRLLGRGFTRAEVDTIDSALDGVIDRESAGSEILPQDSVPGVPHYRISPAGIALIQRFEGLAKVRHDGLVEAYPDPGTGGDPWTIGWGATGPGIARGTVWTRAACDARLEVDLLRYAAEVADALGDAPTSQAQFDALVSFHYNTGAIRKATLTRLHKAGDHAAAAGQFERWCHAGGRVMRGLVRRRAAEAALYRA